MNRNLHAAQAVESYNQKIKRILITEEEIRAAIQKVGKEIDATFDGRPILLVSILKGAFVFMADLCRTEAYRNLPYIAEYGEE